MPRSPIILLATTALLFAACSGAPEATPGTRPHRLRATATLAGLDRPVTARATVAFPASWRVVDDADGKLRLREGADGCHYTVDATLQVVQVEAPTATDAARSIVSTADGRVLETGVRQSAAWRIVKLRGNGTQVRLAAVRVQPLRFIGQQSGHQTWLATTMRAHSDTGDECHAGTYRDTLGPQLGDALATLRARA